MPATVRRTLQQLSNLHWLMPLPINASHRSELTLAILSITIVILISGWPDHLDILASETLDDSLSLFRQRLLNERTNAAKALPICSGLSS